MTVKETGAIMDILETAYPIAYKSRTEKERNAAIKLWAKMFADDDLEIVAVAVKAFIVTDEKGFPPAVGAIKNKIADMKKPDEMTEYEAWHKVRNAISNCGGGKHRKGYYKGGTSSETFQENASVTIINGKPIYRTGGEYVLISEADSCEQEFNKLPPVLQRLVGSPNALREWAQMNSETLESVVGSNFMRSYRTRTAHEREYDMLPGDVKTFISALSDKMKLPETAAYPTTSEINDRRNEIYKLLGEA